MEPCAACRGSGMMDTMDGAGYCWVCNGDGYVRARDDKGRFIKVETPEKEENG